MKFRNLFIACCMAACLFPLPVGAADAADGTIVVRQGQSLGAIAAQHKVSVAQLCEWNKLSSQDKIRVGQKLYVRAPDAASASAPAPATPPAKPDAASASASAPTSPPAKPDPATPPAKKAAPAPPPTAPEERVRMHAPDSVPEKVKLELANVGRTLVNNAAKTITPNSKSKAVAPSGDGYVASYMEVDASDIRTEVIPSAASGSYVGSIRYVEKRYECPGKNKADALKAECRMVKARRMNELIRYEKGKWHY
jgi:LysM repeat protein